MPSIVFLTCLLISALHNHAASFNRMPEKVKKVLENAISLEIYSLDPDVIVKDTPGIERYFGWKVLGKTVVKIPIQKMEVVTAIKRGVEKGNFGAICFWPRHGIRAKHNNVVVDLVICFECYWIYVYYDGKEVRADELMTKDTARDLLNKILKDASVPLPATPKK